jgi:mono/diheme cytochrome c family protein
LTHVRLFGNATAKLAKLIMTRRALILCVGVAFAASLLTTLAADKKAVDVSKIPPASDKKGVTYEADIKPIFEKSCVKCHGAEKQKGKLRLDSLAATLKGGEDGKVIEAGNSAKSLLVHNVAHVGDEDMFMPPPDNKDKIQPLTKEQVGLIRAWIDQGAK